MMPRCQELRSLLQKEKIILHRKFVKKQRKTTLKLLKINRWQEMLYANVDIGAEIPPELYQAVAEILAMVYNMRKQGGEVRRKLT